jgi:hypothetical protein
MRLIRFLLSYVLLNIFALLAAMFLAQNLRVERLTFFGINFAINFAWILLGSVAFGFLAAFLLLLPGRIAAHLESWTLDHEAEELENQVGLLLQQREDMLSRLSAMLATQERVLARYHKLLADHSQVVAELDKVKAQSSAVATVATQKPAPARATAPVAAPARATAPVAAPARATAPVAILETEPAFQTSRTSRAWTTRDWTARTWRDSAKAQLSKKLARLLPEPAPPPMSPVVADSQPDELYELETDALVALATVND